MEASTYKIIHLTGIAALALGIGGMMGDGGKRKAFAILQGVGLLVMLVSGFGLIAKIHPHTAIPHYAIVKLILWLVIGLMPMLLRKMRAPLFVGVLISLTLVAVMAWLGVTKPALWGH